MTSTALRCAYRYPWLHTPALSKPVYDILLLTNRCVRLQFDYCVVNFEIRITRPMANSATARASTLCLPQHKHTSITCIEPRTESPYAIQTDVQIRLSPICWRASANGMWRRRRQGRRRRWRDDHQRPQRRTTTPSGADQHQ